MKKLYVCLFGILAWSGSAMVSPCVAGTIASYAALGATGCTVGASNQFTIANVAFVMVAVAAGSSGPTSPSDIGFNATVVGGNPEVGITAINGTSFDTSTGLLGVAGLYNAEIGFSVGSTVPPPALSPRILISRESRPAL